MSAIGDPSGDIMRTERIGTPIPQDVIWFAGIVGLAADQDIGHFDAVTYEQLLAARDVMHGVTRVIEAEISKREFATALLSTVGDIASNDLLTSQLPDDSQVVVLRPNLSVVASNPEKKQTLPKREVIAQKLCAILLADPEQEHTTEEMARMLNTTPSELAWVRSRYKTFIGDTLAKQGLDSVTFKRGNSYHIKAIPPEIKTQFLQRAHYDNEIEERKLSRQQREAIVESRVGELYDLILNAVGDCHPKDIRDFFRDRGLAISWLEIDRMVYPRLTTLAEAQGLRFVREFGKNRRKVSIVS